MPIGLYPSREEFAAAANEPFEAAVGESSVVLTLTEVSPLPVHPYPGMTREPFSLTFRSASPVILPQRSFRLTNATIGALDIFLVAVARNAQGIVYQAIFN